MKSTTHNLFRKILSGMLSAACVFSGTAVAGASLLSAKTLEVSAATTETEAPFSWDNASVYFLLTDRFCNGNTSNDHSYGRGLDKNGNIVSGYKTEAAFQGGDFAGITKKLNEGYFDDLGVNAIWLSAPYEQIHGYVVGGNGSPSFPHWSYHGYYVLDYTETDANFGTKEEFQTMVDTAHEHGIRIVMDIVMNHAGYNDLQTMSEYSFGSASGWENYYYSYQNTNNTDYHSFVDYTSQSAWAKWWGPDWIRCGLPGYSSGSGEVAGSLEGLPDFKTESTTTVGIPEVLKTKWNKEGTYSEKVAKYGSSGTVRSYLVKWLTEWVKQYGVDGFRCDTAKHVEMESWKALKDAGVVALNEWRQNNPTKPGADWTDDFWMTGECFGHKAEKSYYYTSGAFDSMINFSFTSVGSCNVPSAGSVEGVYSDYASRINSDPSFNVLTYLASHDTTLITGDRNYAGSFLLMCPGGIQIYYGDEINRPMASVSSDSSAGAGHMFRSFMNWDSMDKNVLAHWQKVGQFRRNHLSVGAGQHKVISSYSSGSGYTFARTYSNGGVEDKIVATLFAPANTSLTIDVSSVWSDGIEITNFYDGTTCVVSGGKVTFNTGANGTILMQEPQGKKGKVVVTHIDKDKNTVIKTETMAGLIGDSYKVSALSLEGYTVASTSGSMSGTYSETDKEVKIYYTFDTNNYGFVTVKYVDAATGDELADAETTTGKVGTAYSVSPKDIKNYECDESLTTNATGTYKKGTTTVTFKYNYVEPTNLRVHYYNKNNWGSVYMYSYDEKNFSSVKEYNGKWPGTQMTAEGDGWFVCEADAEWAQIIFNNNAGTQEPSGGTQASGYECSGEVYIKDGKQVTTGKVSVKYITTDGKTLASQTITGLADGLATYTTTAKTFDGYTLKTTPSNASGTITESTITVTYIYEADSVPSDPLANNSTISATNVAVNGTIKLTAKASGGTSPYLYTYRYRKSGASSWTTVGSSNVSDTTKSFSIATAGTYKVAVLIKDSTSTVVSKVFTVTVGSSSALANNSTISATTVAAGATIKLTAKASGGTSPYLYTYRYRKSGASSWTTLGSSNVSYTTKSFSIATAGNYEVAVLIKDSTLKVVSKIFDVTVSGGSTLANNSTISATTVEAGAAIKLTAKASGGTSPYLYTYRYRTSGATSWKTVGSSNVTAATKSFPIAAAGNYEVAVLIKDSTSKVVSKIFTVKVTASSAVTNNSTISATSVTASTAVTLTGKASGGTSPYYYTYQYKLADDSTWTTVGTRNGTATTGTLRITTKGTYDARVIIKDAAGKAATKNFTLTVKAAAATTLVNNSTVSKTSFTLGDKLTLKGAASGGTSPYKYAFYAMKSTANDWTVLGTEYGTATSVSFTPKAAVTYLVRIDVMDSTGAVVSKSYAVLNNG